MSPPATTFSIFGTLPAEMRLEIWKNVILDATHNRLLPRFKKDGINFHITKHMKELIHLLKVCRDCTDEVKRMFPICLDVYEYKHKNRFSQQVAPEERHLTSCVGEIRIGGEFDTIIWDPLHFLIEDEPPAEAYWTRALTDGECAQMRSMLEIRRWSPAQAEPRSIDNSLVQRFPSTGIEMNTMISPLPAAFRHSYSKETFPGVTTCFHAWFCGNGYWVKRAIDYVLENDVHWTRRLFLEEFDIVKECKAHLAELGENIDDKTLRRTG